MLLIRMKSNGYSVDLVNLSFVIIILRFTSPCTNKSKKTSTSHSIIGKWAAMSPIALIWRQMEKNSLIEQEIVLKQVLSDCVYPLRGLMSPEILNLKSVISGILAIKETVSSCHIILPTITKN